MNESEENTNDKKDINTIKYLKKLPNKLLLISK